MQLSETGRKPADISRSVVTEDSLGPYSREGEPIDRSSLPREIELQLQAIERSYPKLNDGILHFTDFTRVGDDEYVAYSQILIYMKGKEGDAGAYLGCMYRRDVIKFIGSGKKSCLLGKECTALIKKE